MGPQSPLRTGGRSLLPGSLPAAPPGPARTRPLPLRPEKRTESRGPRKANKRPGRAGPVSGAQALRSHCCLPYPEPRPSQPQPRRRAGDACPAHAADSRPRSAGLSSGPAPGRSRRPLLKDRQAAPRTKPARGYMRPSGCQSRLAIQQGHPEPSNRRPSRAQVQRWLAGPSRVGQQTQLTRHNSALRVVREPQHHLPRSLPEEWAEVGRERWRNYNVDYHSGGQFGHATHLLRTFDGSAIRSHASVWRLKAFAAWIQSASFLITTAPFIPWAAQWD